MTDDRIDALVRGLDTSSEPTAAFADRTLDALLPHVRRARRFDASRFAAVARALRAPFGDRTFGSTTSLRPALLILVVVLMLLLVVGALILAGSPRRVPQLGNGPLIVATPDGLRRVTAGDTTASAIVVNGPTRGASRAPDGSLISFWTTSATGDRLEVIGLDGRDRRMLTGGLHLAWNDCIDTWSLDSRILASEVAVDGSARILIGDASAGTARLLTPAGLVAHCPLVAPDGKSVAFAMVTSAGRSLAVIGIDGQGLRVFSGSPGDLSVSGPGSWSPEGSWIYFDATTPGGSNRVYRANVERAESQVLTPAGLVAAAPALSPDGSRLAFIVPHGWFDLYVSMADGTNAHLVLANAGNDGWSSDGRLILADWRPPTGIGGLVTIQPDGSTLQVVYPFPPGCTQARGSPGCVDSVGWGQPRP